MIENVLAERYTCNEIKSLFSTHMRYVLEREFWIVVLKSQIDFGLKVPEGAIHSYEKVKNKIDLESIKKRETLLKHDLKARIEEFNQLAGYEYIHVGLTSRDVTENIELYQIKMGLQHLREKSMFYLSILGEKIAEYKEIQYVARTHNVPAQLSTFGRRLAVIAEELISAISKLDYEISNLKFRGLKGAVGTSADLNFLFGDTVVDVMEKNLAEYFGFNNMMNSVGQIYPRSYDFGFVSTLVQLVSAIDNFAINFRLMAGFGLVSEGFSEFQVGSSAMPHKKNARLSERINGLCVILKGLNFMVAQISGNQWNEGDVSCSVVRRIAIPDVFFTVDGILNNAINLLCNMKLDLKVMSKEISEEKLDLVSSRILMEAVKNGVGREVAHKKIKQKIQNFRKDPNKFMEALIKDKDLKLSSQSIEELINSEIGLLGLAHKQCEITLNRIELMKSGKSSVLLIPDNN